MPQADNPQRRISALTERLRACANNLARLRADKNFEQHKKARDEDFISVLRDACSIVQESEDKNPRSRQEILRKAQGLLDEAIGIAYGEAALYDFMPSWAHDENDRPLVMDRRETILEMRKLVYRILELDELTMSRQLMGKFQIFYGCSNSPKSEASGEVFVHEVLPKAWDPSAQPHSGSTRLARFHNDLPPLTPASANSLALSVLEARCEISSQQICPTFNMQLNPGGSCLALTGEGGYNGAPGLNCFFLDQDDRELYGFAQNRFVDVGLAGVIVSAAVDEDRKLVFVGDEDRVKSYSWEIADGTLCDELLPTHTLYSDRVSGPMIILPNGTVIRAGRGSAAVWEIESLETHGPDGQEIIGKEKDLDDFSFGRGDVEWIETSSGNLPTSRIKFANQPTLEPSIWEPLVNSPASVLCAENSGSYGCLAVDLEHGAKVITRYLGHGAIISSISVSAADPQMFLTACRDGFARLFDTRQALPVFTLDACGQHEMCDGVALAHPDGVPTAFTGTNKYAVIKVWDVRARTSVYELATGNNGVMSLTWDDERGCLLAATECNFMARSGDRFGYRRAKMPKRGFSDEGSRDMNDSRKCWPSEAWRAEDYFGYTLDAGRHMIYRYAFKEDPRPDVLPEYGGAQLREWDSW